MAKKGNEAQVPPSANWLALQKKLKPSKSNDSLKGTHPPKKRKIRHERAPSEAMSEASASVFPRGSEPPRASTSTSAVAELPDEVKNGESLRALRRMMAGDITYTEAQKQPEKYLAIDCEMVGVGINGKESSLARVSIVNYYGAVQLDEFVRQKERVVDYRTEWSGIRPTDMVKANTFEEVQKQVADLLKDRILVGHAVHNDLKALLLSHPRPFIRDTQALARKHKLTNSSRPALRHLVQQELGVAIQGGEHSSVVDARATMAVYRIHRRTWEKGMPQLVGATVAAKRKHAASEVMGIEDGEGDDDGEGSPTTVRVKAPSASVEVTTNSKKSQAHGGGGRKGMSSGLSTIIKRKEVKSKSKSSWWKDLGGGSKGSLKL